MSFCLPSSALLSFSFSHLLSFPFLFLMFFLSHSAAGIRLSQSVSEPDTSRNPTLENLYQAPLKWGERVLSVALSVCAPQVASPPKCISPPLEGAPRSPSSPLSPLSPLTPLAPLSPLTPLASTSINFV